MDKSLTTKREIASLIRHYVEANPGESAGLLHLDEQLADTNDATLERSNMRGHMTSSVLLLSQDRTQALMIFHKHHRQWLQPGGHFELPDTLWDSAFRELQEETGFGAAANAKDVLEPQLALPLDIDTHAITARPQKGEASHWHHDVLFLAHAKTDFVPQPQLEEVQDARWIPLREMRQLPGRRLAKLLGKLEAMGYVF
jgi:8-oxo-dGTP pyrophosphatase MutT (NUDIX family)